MDTTGSSHHLHPNHHHHHHQWALSEERWFHLEEWAPGSSLSTSSHPSSSSPSSSSPPPRCPPRSPAEQEIYVSHATVVWSQGAAVKRVMTVPEEMAPIRNVLWVEFATGKASVDQLARDAPATPTSPSTTTATTTATTTQPSKRTLCILSRHYIRTYHDDGNYYARWSFVLESAWSLAHGLLLKSTQTGMSKCLYFLSHPLAVPQRIRMDIEDVELEKRSLARTDSIRVMHVHTEWESNTSFLVTTSSQGSCDIWHLTADSLDHRQSLDEVLFQGDFLTAKHIGHLVVPMADPATVHKRPVVVFHGRQKSIVFGILDRAGKSLWAFTVVAEGSTFKVVGNEIIQDALAVGSVYCTRGQRKDLIVLGSNGSLSVWNGFLWIPCSLSNFEENAPGMTRMKRDRDSHSLLPIFRQARVLNIKDCAGDRLNLVLSSGMLVRCSFRFPIQSGFLRQCLETMHARCSVSFLQRFYESLLELSNAKSNPSTVFGNEFDQFFTALQQAIGIHSPSKILSTPWESLLHHGQSLKSRKSRRLLEKLGSLGLDDVSVFREPTASKADIRSVFSTVESVLLEWSATAIRTREARRHTVRFLDLLRPYSESSSLMRSASSTTFSKCASHRPVTAKVINSLSLLYVFHSRR